jgi:hypothetical protein
MTSRPSCTDGSRNGLTIANKGPTPVTPSQTPLSVPLVSFFPNRRRCWSPHAISNQPRDKIMLRPCSVLRNSPGTIRYAPCLLLCSRVSSMGYPLRSLSVWHPRAHWPTGGSFRTNGWSHSMVPRTIPPKRCIATPVSGVNAPMATPAILRAPFPR